MVLLFVAVGLTLSLFFVGGLLSVDEEWGGWGDVLLNPYIMGPYLAVMTGCLAGAVVLVRRP